MITAKRYFIKENIELLFTCLDNGDKVTYQDNGILVVVGYSDNSPRKYIKVLSKDNSVVESLLQDAIEKVKDTLFVKIKKNNPVRQVFEQNCFVFKGDRGKEILLEKRV